VIHRHTTTPHLIDVRGQVHDRNDDRLHDYRDTSIRHQVLDQLLAVYHQLVGIVAEYADSELLGLIEGLRRPTGVPGPDIAHRGCTLAQSILEHVPAHIEVRAKDLLDVSVRLRSEQADSIS